MPPLAKGDQDRWTDAHPVESGRSVGRVLIVAPDVGDSGNLLRTLAAGERYFGGGSCAMTLLVTVGLARVVRAMAASSFFGLPAIPHPEMIADSERHVRRLVASVGRDVSLDWRCVGESAEDTLKQELAAMLYAHVVIGCTGSRHSRRVARRLVRTAERSGCSASVVGAGPQHQEGRQ